MGQATGQGFQEGKHAQLPITHKAPAPCRKHGMASDHNGRKTAAPEMATVASRKLQAPGPQLDDRPFCWPPLVQAPGGRVLFLGVPIRRPHHRLESPSVADVRLVNAEHEQPHRGHRRVLRQGEASDGWCFRLVASAARVPTRPWPARGWRCTALCLHRPAVAGTIAAVAGTIAAVATYGAHPALSRETRASSPAAGEHRPRTSSPARPPPRR